MKVPKVQNRRNEREDGECSSPDESLDKYVEVVELLDDGSFVLDRSALEDSSEVVEIVSAPSIHNRSSSSSWMAGILTESSDESCPVKKNSDSCRFKPKCFNCNGDHNLNKCSEPKNMKRIRENQNAFRQAVQNRPDGRYHDSSTASSGMKPGRLSDSLMRALDCGPNDIPEYIYRMRKMGFVNGYPPAYLKRAVVLQRSGGDGETLTFHEGDGDRKSEGAPETRPSSPSINPNDIIFYFGFNKTYRNLRDKERFIVPPFDEFVRYLEKDMKKKWRAEAEKKKRKRPADSSASTSPPLKKGKTNETTEEKEKDGEGKDVQNNHSPQTARIPASPSASTLSDEAVLILGTPVLRERSGGKVQKPSLDAFSQGIIPFQVDEPTRTTGFFKKMMSKIRSALS